MEDHSMTTIGAYEAKTHLSELLERVSRGETITITKHGKPIAQLKPFSVKEKPDVRKVIEEFRAYSRRHGRTLGNLTIREMIEEGRRY
jgi:prevent-host-death family protein